MRTTKTVTGLTMIAIAISICLHSNISSADNAEGGVYWWNFVHKLFSTRETNLVELVKDIYWQDYTNSSRLEKMTQASRQDSYKEVRRLNDLIPKTVDARTSEQLKGANHNDVFIPSDINRLVVYLRVPQPVMAAILHGRTDFISEDEQKDLLAWYCAQGCANSGDIEQAYASLIEDFKTQAAKDFAKLLKTPPPTARMSSIEVNGWVNKIANSEQTGWGSPTFDTARRIVILKRDDYEALKKGEWFGRKQPSMNCRDMVVIENQRTHRATRR